VIFLPRNVANFKLSNTQKYIDNKQSKAEDTKTSDDQDYAADLIIIQDARNDYGYGYISLANCGFNYYSGYEERLPIIDTDMYL